MPKFKKKKRQKPEMVVCDVNINATVKIPIDEFDLAKDDEGLESYLETNLDLTFLFGDAWICSVDRVEEMERE